jgi:signal transduction histidine kinase
MNRALEYRVLVLPATRRDGVVAIDLLERAGIACEAMDDASAMARAMGSPVGALIVADTALARPNFGAVLDVLARQPAWSDLPVVLMSRAGEVSGDESVATAVDLLTNVTVIDRPTSVRVLVSAVQAALRARERQYQIRDQLEALRVADEALRLADRRKDEFLATLAHELRNPLAPLRSALQVLEMRRGAPEGQHGELLALMDRQMKVMVRLIDDLLDVARISSGKVVLHRQRLDLRSVARTAAEAAMPAIRAADHRLDMSLPDAPAFVVGDATRLAQVIGNLLNNASKYTPPGGRIGLAMRLEADTVVIEVSDNGAGIPAELLEQVFELFAQVNRTLDRAQGGLGIGLSLVRRMLDMHGGSIEAFSDGDDRGSTFTIRLPRVVEATASGATTAGGSVDVDGDRSARRLRILVVDDNQDAADTLALLLETSGHDVRSVYSGPQALAAAESFRPVVVLCDIGMPGMSGHEVAARLRADTTHAATTLVALTGWGAEEDKRQAEEAGFDAHLTKPVDINALDGFLERL